MHAAGREFKKCTCLSTCIVHCDRNYTNLQINYQGKKKIILRYSQKIYTYQKKIPHISKETQHHISISFTESCILRYQEHDECFNLPPRCFFVSVVVISKSDLSTGETVVNGSATSIKNYSSVKKTVTSLGSKRFS